MNETPRKVKFSTKLNILKRKPISMLVGLLFTIIPLFIVLILFIVFSSIGNDDREVDYVLINKNGTETNAIITNIDIQYNVTINGLHPTIISYKYSKYNKETKFKFKTLSDINTKQLEIGNEIQIKEYKGDSIIMNLKPYDFSFSFFLLIPIPFLCIGLPFLLYSIFNLRKELKLYQYGKIINAKILSMIPKSGLPVSNVGQGIIIHYEYETTKGKKIIGESFTSDFSIMNEKRKDDFIPIFVSLENEEKSVVISNLEAIRNNWKIEF